jgi:hypothetical protein
MDCCIKKTTLDQKTLEQNGYGFLHYSLDEDGIQSALQASRTIKQIHIQNVLYDCSLTWSVDAMLKQRGELQQPPEPSRPLFIPETQQPKELFIPSGASSNAMFLPPAAVLPDDFDFGELVYKKPPVPPAPHMQQQQHHHHPHHQFSSAHQSRHYHHQQPLQPQQPSPGHHFPTGSHFPKQHYQPPQQQQQHHQPHLLHHSNQHHHPFGITPSRSLSDPSGRLLGQPMPPAHQHHHYHHQQQPKILTSTLNSPSLSHNNNNHSNNVFGLSNSHFLAPNLVINSEPPSPAYLTSTLASSPSYNPFALSSVSETGNNHEKNSFGLEVQAPDDNMNYSLSPSPEKNHHSAAAVIPLRSFASYIPDSSFKTYGDVFPSDFSDFPNNNNNNSSSHSNPSFSPPPSPTKQYSPKYSSNK